MRRNKVRPLDNGGKEPIEAFNVGNNSDHTDGVLQQPLIDGGSIEKGMAWGPENTSTPSSAIPHSSLVGASVAADSHPRSLVSRSKKSRPFKATTSSEETLLSDSWKETAPSEATLVSDTPPTSLKRLIAVDRSSSEQLVTSVVTPPWTTSEGNNMVEQNDAGAEVDQDLLKYFTELNNHDNGDIDMDEAARILLEGANVNSRGTDGQTCMHLAARHWKKEVIQFLFEKGANLHEPDDFGVTPLHEAAQVDNEEVVSYLIKKNPDISCMTSDTCQTALHYAVLGSAINSIYMLVEAGADLEMKDHRGRTPLHLAAERDRTVAALVLLSLNKPAMGSTCDDSGHSILVCLIQNMPEVTHLALNQLQESVNAKRSQHYYLSALEPAKTRGDVTSCKTPLQEIVYWQRYELLTHPVISKLLEIKWQKSGWIAFVVNSILYMLFLVAWTIFISSPVHQYDLPRDWWRILILVVAIMMLIQQVAEEMWEYWYSSQQQKTYKKWRTTEYMRDLELTRDHPEETEYLNKMISQLHRPNYYFQDEWNLIDLATFITLFVIIITHFVDVSIRDRTHVIGTIHVRISCLAVILIWCRLFKLGRVFPAISPFIAVIRGLIADILRFVVVYVVLFVPFLICFWIIFSSVDDSVQGSEELTSVHRMGFMLFRMTLIDDYPYSAMRQEDEVMALILVGTFLFITAVVGINLFIALLSNTFQRVYDNTLANAEMQRTKLMLQLENVYSPYWIGQRYLDYIHNHCNPLVCTFDDDDILNEQDLRRATLQIRSSVKHVEQQLISQDSLLKEQQETISGLKEEFSSLCQTLNSHLKVPQTAPKLILPPLKAKRSYPLMLNEVQSRLRRGSRLRSSTQYMQDDRLGYGGMPHSPSPVQKSSLRWIRARPAS